MIKLPMLTEKDLEPLQGKNIVLECTPKNFVEVYRILKSFDLNVVAYIYGKTDIVESVLLKIVGKSVKKISKSNLKKTKEILLSYDNMEFVLSDSCNSYIAESISRAMDTDALPVFEYTCAEIENSFQSAKVYNLKSNPLDYFLRYYYWRYLKYFKNPKDVKKIMRKKTLNPIVVCSPPKTADVSLMRTFKYINQVGTEKIEAFNLWHRPGLVSLNAMKKHKTIKFIVGIRDPIAQNLSVVFENIASGVTVYGMLFREIENNKNVNRIEIMEKYERIFKLYVDDVQLLWDAFLDTSIKRQSKSKRFVGAVSSIQAFMPLFQEHVVDIMAYDFNKEVGYTIIKEKNVEVFVYQLEKLNAIIPELSEWVGAPFDKLENANEASSKWIAESYKQAQKEIEITQEYFDKCFDESYVQHCYSEADIEKFKEKWRSHIK